MIAVDFAGPVAARCNVSIDPVVIAILATVQDVGKYLASVLNRVPEQFENASRHLRMPYQAMGLAKAFFLGVSGYPQKDVVAVGQPPLEIGFADDDFVLTEKPFDACECYFSGHV